jgi:hypothetical protein
MTIDHIEEDKVKKEDVTVTDTTDIIKEDVTEDIIR